MLGKKPKTLFRYINKNYNNNIYKIKITYICIHTYISYDDDRGRLHHPK